MFAIVHNFFPKNPNIKLQHLLHPFVGYHDIKEIIMSDFVTGTPSVVGFTNGHNDHGFQYGFNYGISDKDQQFATSIDAGERTRDILSHIYDSIVTTEKTGAAGILEAAKNGAALQVQIAASSAAFGQQAAANQQASMMYANTNASTLAAQLAECCCDIKKDIADIKATILAVDAHRIRDDLGEARAELLALRFAHTGNGNGNG
jgi:hypothetical protein